MEESILVFFLYRSVVFGAIPLAFLLISAFIAFRRHKVLVPVVVSLALYQATCFLMLRPTSGGSPGIPEVLELQLLSVFLPLSVALGGTVWSMVATKVPRERMVGCAISTVGSGLTAGQAYFFITIIWGTI